MSYHKAMIREMNQVLSVLMGMGTAFNTNSSEEVSKKYEYFDKEIKIKPTATFEDAKVSIKRACLFTLAEIEKYESGQGSGATEQGSGATL